MKYTFFLTVILALLIPPVLARASLLYVEPQYKTIDGGSETLYVDVLVDTGSNTINAIESSITVSGAKVFDTVLNQSIVGYWIKEPELENDVVKFSSLKPGGYSSGSYVGQENVSNYNRLFTLVLRPTSETVTVSFDQQKTIVLLNDGSGTRDSVETTPRSLKLSDLDVRVKEIDLVPPKDLAVDIVEDYALPKGTYLFVISATDDQSGIDRYEMLDRDTGEWIEIGSRFSTSYPDRIEAIRVFDKSGNVSVLSINNKGSSSLWYILTIVVVLLAIYLFYALFYRKHQEYSNI